MNTLEKELPISNLKIWLKQNYCNLFDRMRERNALVRETVKKGRMLSFKEIYDILDNQPAAKHVTKFTQKCLGQEWENDAAALVAAKFMPLIGWVFSKKVYRLDGQLTQQLLETPIDLELVDVDLLERLPYFTTIFYSPFIDPWGDKAYGFGATLDKISSILLLSIYNEVDNSMDEMSLEFNLKTKEVTVFGISDFGGFGEKSSESLKLYASSILSVIMYLCSDNFMLSNSVNGYKTVSKKTMFKTPDKIVYIQTGKKDGDIIRQFNSDLATCISKDRKMKPHIRKAHWHSYWVGTTGSKTKILKFIPATFVNTDKEI